MHLTQEWDKTFPQSEKVDHRKVTFKNRYGITLAADLYRAETCQRQAGSDCRGRPLWRREGTVLGPLRADHGGTRIRHAGFRSVLYRRKWWRATQCRLAGYQY
jgi:hypothetical protein